MKAISTLTSVVIIVSVAIAISIAVALWSTGIVASFTGIEKLEIYGNYYERINNTHYMIFYLKNTGTKPVTIDDIFVDNKPYKDEGFDAYFVKAKNFDPRDLNNGYLHLNISVSGTTSGYGCSGNLAPRSINALYKAPLVYTVENTIRINNLQCTIGSNVVYTFIPYAVTVKYVIGFLNNTSSDYMIYLIYYDNSKTLSIKLLVSSSPVKIITLYSKTIDLLSIIGDGKWHNLVFKINMDKNLSSWNASFYIDNTSVVANVSIYKTSANVNNVTISLTQVVLPSFDISSSSNVYASLRYNIDYSSIVLKVNDTTIKDYKFDDQNSLNIYYNTSTQIEGTYYDLIIWINSIGFDTQPDISIMVVKGYPLPFTLMPGEKAVLVLYSNNVSPGTMYSILIHTSSGGRYPSSIQVP